jgi:hypothetical protein
MSSNTEKIIHVVGEMIVVFGLVFYFKKTNNQLILQVNEKFKILEDQIKKQEHIINCLSDKLNSMEVTKHRYEPPEKCKNSFDDKINATYTSFPSKKQPHSGKQQFKSEINKKSIPLFNLDNLQNIGLGGVVMMGNMPTKKKVEFNIEELKDESDDEKNTQKEEIKEEEDEEEEEEEDEEEIEKELASELKDLLG